MNDKAYKDVDSFVVERSRWLRGKDNGVLLTPEGQMCCLGFYAKACAFKDEDIKNVGGPFNLYLKGYKWDTKLLNEDNRGSQACHKAIEINDDSRLSSEYRESALTQVFESIGIKVTFVD